MNNNQSHNPLHGRVLVIIMSKWVSQSLTELLLVRFPENQKSDFQKITNWISRETEMKTMGALIFCASLLLVVVSKIWLNANVNLNKSSACSWWQKTQFQSFFQLVDETSGVPLCWGNIDHLCPPRVDIYGPYGSRNSFRTRQMFEASRRRNRERYGFRNYWLRQISAHILFYQIRFGVLRKNCCSFGFCPNLAGGLHIFFYLFLSALLVNKRSPFPPKCQ